MRNSVFSVFLDQEQIETPNDTGARASPVTAQPDGATAEASGGIAAGGSALDEEVAEEDVTVEMPPPMEELHTVSLQPSSTNQEEDLVSNWHLVVTCTPPSGDLLHHTPPGG